MMDELRRRAYSQKIISTEDAKRIGDYDLNLLIVADSINGMTPRSLFGSSETLGERALLQGSISTADFQRATSDERTKIIANGIYPSMDAPGIADNLPSITRETFEAMSMSEKSHAMQNGTTVTDTVPGEGININQIVGILSQGATDE